MTTTLQKSEVIDLLNRLLHEVKQLETVETEIVHGLIVDGIDRDRVVALVEEYIQDVIKK